MKSTEIGTRENQSCVLPPQLCARLVRELRVLALMWPGHPLPPPSDVEAEQDVVSGVLWGTLPPRALLPLCASHLVVPLLREVYGAAEALDSAGEPTDAQAIAEWLVRHGAQGADLESLLETLSCLPHALPDALRARAARVVERSQARSVCGEIRAVDALLRLGDLTADEACDRLTRFAATGAVTP